MTEISQEKPVHVLHLEDNQNDRLLVEEMLRADGLDCRFVAVQTQVDFETELTRSPYDVIISDYSMPGFDGLSGLAIARKMAPSIPFIFFSGTIGEESAIESLKNGAVDYIIKQHPQRLVPAIRQALRNASNRTLLQQVEQRNREQAELLDKATDAILVCDRENRIIYWNRSAQRIYGWTEKEIVRKNITILFQDQPSPRIREMIRGVEDRGEWTGELQQWTKDGRAIFLECRATLIRDEHGQPKSLLLINTDVTERKQLEEQFLRSQRLESLGVLISGIAHDLNNALAPILIGVDVLRNAPDNKKILKTIEGSAKRGADMVQQVLAFARGGDSRKISIRLESLIKEMGKIISDTFPKNIVCDVKVDAGLWPVSGLPTQLYQVLLNLCVNARDAMPNGGNLSLAAENACLDAAAAAEHREAKAGEYVCVTVKDTGTGITQEQMKKIFHPFFTTKEPGKGTGLGLSTSLSIIKNHGGFMSVRSTVGRGTEFKFYLPAAIEAAARPPVQPSLPVGHGEAILVIDDEAIVLVIARTALENYGYRVFTSINGLEAITCLTEKRDVIQGVITDLSMPFMGGGAIAKALRKINPSVKIIGSGESEKEMNDLKEKAVIDAFVAKPFTVENLVTRIHEVLNEKSTR